MRVVFLDVHGVIAPRQVSGVKLSSACVLRLNQITEATGAKIVVTSMLRLVWMRGLSLSGVLNAFGVTGDIIGTTPGFDHPTGLLWLLVSRGEQIRGWLLQHPEVKSWVVLDDDPVNFGPLVRTEWTTGLQDEHVVAAIALLAGRRE